MAAQERRGEKVFLMGSPLTHEDILAHEALPPSSFLRVT